MSPAASPSRPPLGPSRELLVPTTDLVRHPGERRELQRTVVLEGLGISTASVDHDAAVTIDLVLEAQASGIVVSGTVSAPWTGPCRRCLADVRGTTTAEVREVFARNPPDDEIYPMADDFVDLEPMVRDAVLLSLPLAPLCGEDCRGPAPDEFPALAPVDPGDPGELSRDPRWAALDQLRFD